MQGSDYCIGMFTVFTFLYNNNKSYGTFYAKKKKKNNDI